MSHYAKWARREHSEARRIAITLLAGPVFLGLLPFLVARVGPRLDRRLGLPSLRIGRVNRVLGAAYLAYRREVPFIIPRPPKRAAR